LHQHEASCRVLALTASKPGHKP